MRVRAFANMRDIMGGSSFELEVSAGTTTRDLLERLVDAHPALGGLLWTNEYRLTGRVMIILNGRSIEYLQGLATPLEDDDVISLFPPVGGG